MEKTISIDAVAFEEGDAWVVQGIQYNLVAVAKSVQDVPIAFMNAIAERFHVAEHLGLDPFGGIGAAHERFHKMFEEARTEVKSAHSVGRSASTVRLASHDAVAA